MGEAWSCFRVAMVLGGWGYWKQGSLLQLPFLQTHEEVMLGDLQEALPPAATGGSLGSWALWHLDLCSEPPAPRPLRPPGRMGGTSGYSSWDRGDLWACG